MVMATPSKKLSSKMSQSFLVLIMRDPMRLPMGVMDISAPSVNSPMPTTSKMAPIKKSSIRSVGTGTTTKQMAMTMSVMGSTEEIDSSNLSFKLVLSFMEQLL